MGLPKNQVGMYLSQMIAEKQNNYEPYYPVLPKQVTEIVKKKDFLIGDWSTMTREQRQPYI